MPPNFAEKVNDICFKFIWNFKPDKVKRHTIIGPVDKGGLSIAVDGTYICRKIKKVRFLLGAEASLPFAGKRAVGRIEEREVQVEGARRTTGREMA